MRQWHEPGVAPGWTVLLHVQARYPQARSAAAWASGAHQCSTLVALKRL